MGRELWRRSDLTIRIAGLDAQGALLRHAGHRDRRWDFSGAAGDSRVGWFRHQRPLVFREWLHVRGPHLCQFHGIE